MGIKHINKALALPLPTREKFILVTLGKYASNDDDTCFPGIPKLASITGYCEKTVQRAIKVLSRLGIIDIVRSERGNNIYTLNLTGDIESWIEYLKSQSNVFESSSKELPSPDYDSKTCYKVVIKGSNKNIDYKKDECAGNCLPATLNSTLDKSTDLPPSKNINYIEKIWIETIPIYYKGKNLIISKKDKWAIDNIVRKFSNDYPVSDIVEYAIKNWPKLLDELMGQYGINKAKLSFFPDLVFLETHFEIAIVIYVLSQYE